MPQTLFHSLTFGQIVIKITIEPTGSFSTSYNQVRDIMNSQQVEEIKRVLSQHKTFFVATSNDDKPWITGLYMGYDFLPVEGEEDQFALRFYCSVLTDTRKRKNLADNPNVSFYVGPLMPLECIQGTGEMYILDDSEKEHPYKVLVDNAPEAQFFIDNLPVAPAVIKTTEIKLANYYEFDKNRRYFVDAETGRDLPNPIQPPSGPSAAEVIEAASKERETANVG